MKSYYLYIIASLSGVLYVGVTNDLHRRISEHKFGLIDGFTKKYKCQQLVYFESSNDVKAIITREKQIKNWNRVKKEQLINQLNPEWKDLSLEF